MKRPHLVLSLVTLALVGAVSSSCIKRQPIPDEPAGSASSNDAPAATAAVPPAQRPPTGLWGKVEGEDVLAGKGTRAFLVSGQAERVEARYLPVTGQPFSEMVQVKITEPSKNIWDVQLRAGNETRIEKGDTLLATVYFRTEWVADESGEGLTEIVFEQATDPWEKSVTYPTRAGAQWKELHIPFIADGDFDPGEGQFAFRMGYSNQTVQFGGIKLENFKQELALADLPKTKLTYPGQEADAEWRGPAQDRIDQIRKENLAVLVRDGSGNPVENAKVSVRMKKHAFYFGTAVPADLIVGKDNAKFQKITTSYFNMATLENDLKWQPLAGDWGKSYTMERALSATDWLLKQDMAVRGHVLVWPGWENLPSYLKQFEKNPERLKKEVRSHIVEMVTALKGKVVDWDVVNEPFTNHDLLDILGPEIMVEWFQLARKTDPNAKLYINDFAILNGGGGTTGHRDHYEKMIKLLVDKNAPLDGIGFQGHFGTALTGPVDVYKLLERYGKYNKRFAVTEYDLLVEDEDLAAEFTRDFYTIMFSHPLTDSLIMWGFWDARHWKKNAPMYRADWTEKPAGKAYRRLIEQEWATNEDGTTAADGTYKLRAFLGDYEVTVTSGSKKKVIKAKLQKGRTDPLAITL